MCNEPRTVAYRSPPLSLLPPPPEERCLPRRPSSLLLLLPCPACPRGRSRRHPPTGRARRGGAGDEKLREKRFRFFSPLFFFFTSLCPIIERAIAQFWFSRKQFCVPMTALSPPPSHPCLPKVSRTQSGQRPPLRRYLDVKKRFARLNGITG